MENEVKNNVTEDAVEVTETIVEEIATNSSSGLLKKLGVVGGIVIVGGLTYKFAVKPMINKIKSKKDELSEDEFEELFGLEEVDSDEFEEIPDK